MEQSNLKAATVTLGCSLLVLWAVLLGSGGWQGVQRQPQAASASRMELDAFTLSTARIQDRLRTLRRLEKDMFSAKAGPERLARLRQDWHAIRNSIDAFVGDGRNAAATDEQRIRIEQFARLAIGTDERLMQVMTARREVRRVAQADRPGK
jgi:hypothetical protein